MTISQKRKKIFRKEKRHSSVFRKAFQISRKYFSCHIHFNCISNNFFIRVSIFPRTHFHRTCICYDLAAPPSSSKHQRLYLWCNACVGSWNACRNTDIASCTRHLGFRILDSCIWLYHGFMFDHGVRVLSINPNKASPQRSYH